MPDTDHSPDAYTPKIEWRAPTSLRPYAGNARTHSRRQIGQIAESIKKFGFVNPILISDEGEVIAGHGRLEAAKWLAIERVPVVRLSHLGPDERRAYVLADNRLAESAGWDRDILAIELQALIDVDFDLDVIGFELAEIDVLLDDAREADPDRPSEDEADRLPQVRSGPPVCQRGDMWVLGRHVLICGDARSDEDVTQLAAGHAMDLIFTDPPYNVAIEGHVSGKGAIRHREFAFASGEMSATEFVGFLTKCLSNGVAACRNGAIAFVCMDWRHMREMLEAGDAVFSELKNLCVWNKTNGGMGSFYRSKHELVFVWKVGVSPHTNSFGLGETGRYRTNVWDYVGVNSFGTERMEELAMHPTVKPVAMVADALRDCSKRGEHVLDMFGGSGTTLIAAEMTGRVAHVLEYDPAYCDTIIRRFEALTGTNARNEGTGRTFEEMAQAQGQDAGHDLAG